MVQLLVDLGAAVTVTEESYCTPLQSLLRSAALNKKKAATAISNPGECMRAIETLLISFEALWETDGSGIPLFVHILCSLPTHCNALLDGVFRLLSRAPDTSRDFCVLVDALCYLFIKKKYSISVLLLKKYREFLDVQSRETSQQLPAQPVAPERVRRLCRAAAQCGSLQVFSSVCDIFDPVNVLTPDDIRFLVLDCIARRDTLMLQSLLEKTSGSRLLMDGLYELASSPAHVSPSYLPFPDPSFARFQSPIIAAIIADHTEILKSLLISSR
jgi:hypothetical protein